MANPIDCKVKVSNRIGSRFNRFQIAIATPVISLFINPHVILFDSYSRCGVHTQIFAHTDKFVRNAE